MNKAIVEQLQKLSDEGEKVSNDREVELWSSKTMSFLRTAISSDEASNFTSLKDYTNEWAQHALRLGHIQGLISKQAIEAPSASPGAAAAGQALPTGESQMLSLESRKVFIVHGHDNAAKESTARFLEKLGLQPIILHEQASKLRSHRD